MTNNDSNSESSGGQPRRQHYVSAMLLKQWGDRVKSRDTMIGRFDMYTRQTSTGKASTECVFEDRLGAEDSGQAFRAAIAEAEDEWRSVENAAAAKLDKIRPRMDAAGGFTPDIENILKQQQTLDVLRRLAVLHHGRNLRAILERWRDARTSGASADERAENLRAGIAARMAHAEERYRGGVIFAAPPSGSEFIIGSIPVSEDEIYGASDAPAEFMMPLTPLLMMFAARNSLDMAEGVQFTVNDERMVRLWNQDQAARTFGSPLVYYRPSFLAEAEAQVADFTSGGSWHWAGLEQRFLRHPHRIRHQQQKHIRRVLNEQKHRRTECERNTVSGSPTFPEEHQRWCLDNATKLERILDRAGFPPAKPLPPLTY